MQGSSWISIWEAKQQINEINYTEENNTDREGRKALQYQGQESGHAFQSQQAQAWLQAWGRVARNLHGGKGSGDAGQHLAKNESVCPGSQKGQQLVLEIV